MAKLGECFSVIRNGASIRQTDGAGGFPITRIETIADKTINREKFGYAGIYDLAQYRDYILQDGDILMSHINSEKHLGKVALYSKQDDEHIIHGMNLLMLRADTQKVIPEYAKYYFESQKFLRQIGRITKKSVNQASFTVTALKGLEIPLASIIVQRDISEKLKKVDWLVSLRKQQLAKLDELVKARFVEMFGKTSLLAQNQTKRLEECCISISGGNTPSMQHPEYYGGNIPFVKSGDVKGDYIVESTLTLTKTALTETTAKILPKSTLIVVIRSAALLKEFRIGMLMVDAVINQDLKALQVSEDFLPVYLMWAIKMQHQVLLNKVQTMLTSHIRMEDLLNLKIGTPPLSLQNQFATFVERVDQQKQTVQQSLEKLELMKKALMQEYFG